MTDVDGEAWSTRPRDTRERTCGHPIAPMFSVRHAFRVARDPAPQGVTVTRTYEATVEWTSRRDLPGWLAAVADVLTPYDADRFGVGGRSRPDPTADGRFLAAPVEATVRPGDGDPIGAEPYHYWNTPLARLQADDRYPGAVVSATVDLADGPDAIWTGTSTAGGLDARSLDGDLDDYGRVGVTITGRERVRRTADETDPANEGESGPETKADRGVWTSVGESSTPEFSWLGSIVDATVVPEARTSTGSGETAPDGEPVSAVERVATRIDAAWTAFERWDVGPVESEDESVADHGSAVGSPADPYRVPDGAIRAALGHTDGSSQG